MLRGAAMGRDTIIRAVDWFVPMEIRTDTASFWRGRIFAISHLSGPCLAVVILYYLYFAGPYHGIPFWTICIGCAAFWVLPFAMKVTRRLSWVAMFSVCDLIFVSVFGSFFYGGVSSPFLPWFLVALLLGFFYLGERPLLVLGMLHGEPRRLSARLCDQRVASPSSCRSPTLSTVGVISVCAATRLHVDDGDLLRERRHRRSPRCSARCERHLDTAAKMRAGQGGRRAAPTKRSRSSSPR